MTGALVTEPSTPSLSGGAFLSIHWGAASHLEFWGHRDNNQPEPWQKLFMRVTKPARCSQATTQRCQAGPQLWWQQRGDEVGHRAVLAGRGAHQSQGILLRVPTAPPGPPGTGQQWNSLPTVPAPHSTLRMRMEQGVHAARPVKLATSRLTDFQKMLKPSSLPL